jgi:hypothetical protein
MNGFRTSRKVHDCAGKESALDRWIGRLPGEIARQIFPDPDNDSFHYFFSHGMFFAVHSETRNPVVGEILGTNVAKGLAILHDDPKTTIVLVQSREDKILHAKVSDGRCSMYCSAQDNSVYLMDYTEMVLAWGCF